MTEPLSLRDEAIERAAYTGPIGPMVVADAHTAGVLAGVDAVLGVLTTHIQQRRAVLTATNADDERVQWIERDWLLDALGVAPATPEPSVTRQALDVTPPDDPIERAMLLDDLADEAPTTPQPPAYTEQEQT